VLRVLPVLAYLALVVYAIADVVQSDDDDTGGLPKALWILVIVFLPLAGSIAWILVSRRHRQRKAAAPGSGFPAGPVPPAQYPARRRTWESSPTPRAPSSDPDDDPEMRWLLEQAASGRRVEIGDTLTYRAMMLSGVPNLGWVVGYTNISWTLRCNLTCAYICRLLIHMDERGYRYCVPRIDDPPSTGDPFVDLQAGYVLRNVHRFPKQGPAPPWRASQSYPRDLRTIARGELEDGVLHFERRTVVTSADPAPTERAAAAS
jgi:hypothetical protein